MISNAFCLSAALHPSFNLISGFVHHRYAHSITSFNEWGEGTQIEPARSIIKDDTYTKEYLDYGESGPYKYIHLTSNFANNFMGPKSAHFDHPPDDPSDADNPSDDVGTEL